MAKSCNISRSRFVSKTPVLPVLVNGQSVNAKVMTFSTGSFGWNISGKVEVVVDGVPVTVQVTGNLIVVGSKEAPQEEPKSPPVSSVQAPAASNGEAAPKAPKVKKSAAGTLAPAPSLPTKGSMFMPKSDPSYESFKGYAQDNSSTFVDGPTGCEASFKPEWTDGVQGHFPSVVIRS